MKQALISVIVPVYKVEEYIDRCIASLIDQTYTNLEIILVDDGSPDKSGSICDNWATRDSRIRVFHKENGGLFDARNAGMAASSGAYYGTLLIMPENCQVVIDSQDFLGDKWAERGN